MRLRPSPWPGSPSNASTSRDHAHDVVDLRSVDSRSHTGRLLLRLGRPEQLRQVGATRTNVRRRWEDYPVTTEGLRSDQVLMFNGVGGSTVHWEGHFPRFHPSDFRVRSLDGVAEDWPIAYAELEPYYELNERMTGVSGLAGDPANPPRGGAARRPPCRSGRAASRSCAGSRSSAGTGGRPTTRSSPASSRAAGLATCGGAATSGAAAGRAPRPGSTGWRTSSWWTGARSPPRPR
jgi:choline dehydrogenase-like flavoprotein